MDITLIRDSIEDVIKEVVEIMGNEASEQHINIVTKFEDNLPEVMIDRKHLKQALLNIIKNAIAAMPDGGTLTISAVTKDDELQISISDTGIGIQKNSLPRSSSLILQQRKVVLV